jgi:hypothetical protein
MSTPHFATGQSVLVAHSKTHRPPQGKYQVVSAMPLPGGGFQYRIKGDLEKYERVIDERHLAAE